jgi:hypothetical protein
MQLNDDMTISTFPLKKNLPFKLMSPNIFILLNSAQNWNQYFYSYFLKIAKMIMGLFSDKGDFFRAFF